MYTYVNKYIGATVISNEDRDENIKDIYDEVYIYESEECRYTFDEIFPRITYNLSSEWLDNNKYSDLLGVTNVHSDYYKCLKIGYESELEAGLELEDIKNLPKDSNRNEKEYYYCSHCNSYHLTSQYF